MAFILSSLFKNGSQATNSDQFFVVVLNKFVERLVNNINFNTIITYILNKRNNVYSQPNKISAIIISNGRNNVFYNEISQTITPNS